MDLEIDLPKRVLFSWKKILMYALPVAVFAGLLIGKTHARSGRHEKDYVAATKSFTKWEEVLENRDRELVSLQKIMKSHPELHAHYDALIGQDFLASHSPNEAKPFVERALKRTDQPYFSDYAKTSMLIGEKKYEEAFEASNQLKEQMLGDDAFWKSEKSSALFAFNLFRIAILSGQLKDSASEKLAWSELKRYGGWDGSSSPDPKIGQEGFEQLLSHFTVQETSLLDYIAFREEDLSNQ
jgi:hypothetical protein